MSSSVPESRRRGLGPGVDRTLASQPRPARGVPPWAASAPSASAPQAVRALDALAPMRIARVQVGVLEAALLLAQEVAARPAEDPVLREAARGLREILGPLVAAFPKGEQLAEEGPALSAVPLRVVPGATSSTTGQMAV